MGWPSKGRLGGNGGKVTAACFAFGCLLFAQHRSFRVPTPSLPLPSRASPRSRRAHGAQLLGAPCQCAMLRCVYPSIASAWCLNLDSLSSRVWRAKWTWTLQASTLSQSGCSLCKLLWIDFSRFSVCIRFSKLCSGLVAAQSTQFRLAPN
jgi:hypothetical protein